MGNIKAIPPSVLETWPKPNLVDPERRDWMPVFSMCWLAGSTLLVWGRFYLRIRRISGPFGLDDFLMLIAWLSAVAFSTGAWIICSWYGADRHTWDVPPTQFSGAAFCAWVLQLIMLVSSGATKASILLFYRRLVFGTLARRWKLAIYFALAFHALYLIGTVLGYVLICRPLEAYWMSYDYAWKKKYTCAPGNAMNLLIGIFSVVSDLYAVALPFIILHYYHLDIPRSQKIGLNMIFATGLLVAGAGISRTYHLYQLGTTPTYDTSWIGFDLLVWTTIELNLGIMCACAPSLRALFQRYLSTMFSRNSSNNDRSRTTDNSDRDRHQQNDSHQKGPRSKSLDLFDTNTSIDMHTLTRTSLEDGPRDSHPPATYQPHSDSKTHEDCNRIERVRWNSNSTLALHASHDRTLEEATRWQSNSTNGEGQPLRQNGRPRAASRAQGSWPVSPESEVAGGQWKAQSVRSAV